MAFEKVGFIGLGLIGGSIAKKIKENNKDTRIIATAGHIETITEAYKEGIIDNDVLLDIKDFNDCDYIFLCAPVNHNIRYLNSLKDVIRKDCIITDVGSTKSAIHKEVIKLGLEDNFIGGHPMTGSEKTGILNASSSILENAYYIITPTAKTKQSAIDKYRNFVLSLGSIPLVLDYNLHDYSTASISHLPHMIAFSLVNLVKEIDDDNETMKTIAAGGFRDVTRVASSSPVMWENICESNKDQLLKLMDLYIDELKNLRDLIDEDNVDGLMNYFEDAKEYRDSMFIKKAKIGAPVYEIYIDMADEPGQIAAVAGFLADNSISIKNIGIINNREFEEGVLRIEFYEEASIEASKTILTAKGYKIYER